MYKLSTNQLFWLLTLMELGMTILVSFRPIMLEAKQAAWISMSIGACISIGITWVVTKLASLYPEQTLIEMSQTILGKWLGKIIMIPYFIMWYSVMGIILRYAAELLLTYFLDNTPLSVILIMIGAMILYSTFLGIEVVGRSAEVLGPFVILMLAATLALSMNHIHIENLEPLYGRIGLEHILKASLIPTSLLGEAVILTMLLSFASQPKSARKAALLSVSMSSVIIIIATVIVLGVLGPIVAGFQLHPYFSAIRKIQVADFLQRIDAFIIVVWIVSIFFKLSIYLFAASYGTAQWLHMNNRKAVSIVICLIMVVFALIPGNFLIFDARYQQTFWLPIALPINMIGIPLLLLLVGSFRKHRLKKKGRG